MTAFIEEHRGTYGVEPMCKILQIAPSTYYDRRAIARDPDLASARVKFDAALSLKINAAWQDNRKLYGARKIWHVLRREGEDVARCTVERLMRVLGIKGVLRGKKVITTTPDTSQFCPDDKVNRLFMADRPNKLCPYSDASIAYRVTGFRFYLRAHMVGNSLCGVRDRRLCPSHCRLACLNIHEDPVCA
jgi:putative transposase